MNSDEQTLPNNEQILKAILEMRAELTGKIDGLRAEMTGKIDGLRAELTGKIDGLQNEVNNLRTEMDARFEDVRLQMMSFDVRIDRIEALTHEVLNVAFSARADVKVLREEVRSWAKDVAELQLKVV